MGFGGNDGADKANKAAGKNAKLMRQMFMMLGEPYMTPLISALASRAGISPYSLFGNGQQQGQGQEQQFNERESANNYVGDQAAQETATRTLRAQPAPTVRPGAQGPQVQPGQQPRSPLQMPPGQVAQGVPGAGIGQAAPGVSNGSANPMDTMAGVLGGLGGAPLSKAGAGYGAPRTPGALPGGPPAPGMGAPGMGVPAGMGVPGNAPVLGIPGAGAPGGNPAPGGQPAGPERLPALGQQRVNPLPATDPSVAPGWNQQDSIQWNQGRDRIDGQFDNISDRAQQNAGMRMGPGESSISAGLAAKLGTEQMRQTGQLNQGIQLAGFQRQDAAMNQLAQMLSGFMGLPGQAGQLNLGVAQNAAQQEAARQAQMQQAMAAAGGFFI